MEAKFCPFCQRKNKPDAVRCVHCGVLLISHKPGAFTTIGAKGAPGEIRNGWTPCAERLDKIPGDAFALFVMDFEEPMIIQHQPRIIIGRDNHMLGDDMLDMSRYGDISLGISRRHAQITYANGTYTLEDLGSTNGTWLNRRRLSKGQVMPLRNNDQIWLGPLKLMVCFGPEELPAHVTFSIQSRNTLTSSENILTPLFLAEKVGPFLQAIADLETARQNIVEQEKQEVHLVAIKEQGNQIQVEMHGATKTIQLIDRWVNSWREEHLELVGTATLPPPAEQQPLMEPVAIKIVEYLHPELSLAQVEPLAEKLTNSLKILMFSNLEIAP